MATETTTETTETETTETEVAAQTPEELRAELDRTRKALKDANKEAADRRKKLDAIEKAETDKKNAELSEVERLKKEDADKATALTAAQGSLRLERLDNAIEVIALSMDFHDTEDALRLVDRSEIEFGEDGKPDRKQVKAALEKLAKAKSHLVAGNEARRSHDGSPPPRGGRPKPDVTKTDADTERAAQRATGRYGL